MSLCQTEFTESIYRLKVCVKLIQKTSQRCYSPFHKTLNCNPMDISTASSFSDIKKPLWTLRYLLCLIESLKPEHICNVHHLNKAKCIYF